MMEAKMTFECTVKTGHIGAGKYFDKKIIIRASDILEAMSKAKSKAGVKKGKSKLSGQSILEIKKIN
jgi:hypothetical protein